MNGSKPSTAQESLCKLGVLCVHGIGTQIRGETLDTWAGGVVGWLQDWLAARKEELTIQRSALRASQLEDRCPPHVRFRITNDKESSPQTSDWIIAECWWAEDFYPPPFGKLVGWMLTSGSWVIVSHVANLWVRRGREIFRKTDAYLSSLWARIPFFVLIGLLIVAGGLAGVLGAFLLVFFVQLFVLLLAIVSIIPIPSLRSFMKTILLTIQGVLGDSFMFTSNPLARAAVLNHVQDDLRGLEAQCENVVVLAHSQGAAIAYHALADYKSSKLRGLITYGSGLLKLSELQASSKSGGLLNLMRYAVLAIPLYVIAAPSMWYGLLQQFRHWTWIPWHSQMPDLAYLGPLFLIYPPLLALVAFGEAISRTDKYRDTIKKQLGNLPFENFRWLDIFSTHDPVPVGSMFEQRHLKLFQTRSVVNRMNMLVDHTAYWGNMDEFVGLVVHELDRAAGTGLFLRRDRKRLARAIRQRKSRVRWLRLCRTVLSLTAIVPILLRWDRVLLFGKTHVANVVPKSVLDKWEWQTTAGLVEFAVRGWSQPALIVQDFTHAILGVSVIAGLVYLWYSVICVIWQSWNRAAMAESLQLKKDPNVYFWRPAGITLSTGIALYAAARCMWFGGYQKAWQDALAAPHQFVTILGRAFRWGWYLDFVVKAAVLACVVIWLLYSALHDGSAKDQKLEPKEKSAEKVQR